MKTRKRLATLFLALCLVLSMTVPSVFAAEPSKKSWSLGNGGAQNADYFDIENDGTADTDAYTEKPTNTAIDFGTWSYLNQSDATKKIEVRKNYITICFDEDSYKANGWVAIQIDSVTAGTYDMPFYIREAGMGGLTKVYVVKSKEYSEVIEAYNLGTSTVLTKTQNDEIISTLADKNAILNAGYEGVLDSATGADKYQSIGRVTFPETTDYVLLFQCCGDSSLTEKVAYRLVAGAVYVAPVTEGAVACSYSQSQWYPTFLTTAEAAVTEINSAASGVKFQLLDEVATTGNIVVPAGVTLDLNGKTLLATEFTCNGTLADNSDGSGMVKTVKGKTINVADNALLLYDSTNTGYRVYSGYDLTPYGSTLQPLDNDGQRLWIKLTFDNKDAYRVIATGYSDFSIGAAMTWTPDGGTAVTKTLTFEDSHEQTWGENMQKAENYGFYISFTGFEDLASGTLELTPVAWGCNQAADTAISSETSITYTHTAAE